MGRDGSEVKVTNFDAYAPVIFDNWGRHFKPRTYQVSMPITF